MVPLSRMAMVSVAYFILGALVYGSANVFGEMQPRQLAKSSTDDPTIHDEGHGAAAPSTPRAGAELMTPHSLASRAKAVTSAIIQESKSTLFNTGHVTTTEHAPKNPGLLGKPVKQTEALQLASPEKGVTTMEHKAASQHADRSGNPAVKKSTSGAQQAAAQSGKVLTKLTPIEKNPAPLHRQPMTRATPVGPKPADPAGKAVKKAATGIPKPAAPGGKAVKVTPVARKPVAPKAAAPDGKAVKKATVVVPKPAAPSGKAVKKPVVSVPKPATLDGKAVKKPAAGVPKPAAPDGKAVRKPVVGVPKPAAPDGKAAKKPASGVPKPADPAGKAVKKAATGIPKPAAPGGKAVKVTPVARKPVAPKAAAPDGKAVKKATVVVPKPAAPSGKAVKKPVVSVPKPATLDGKAVKKPAAGVPKPATLDGKAVKKPVVGVPKPAAPDGKAVKKPVVGVPKPAAPDDTGINKATLVTRKPEAPDVKVVKKATVVVPKPEAPDIKVMTDQTPTTPPSPPVRARAASATTIVTAPAPVPTRPVLTTTSTAATVTTIKTETPRAASRLQQDLNAFCTTQFQKLCSETIDGGRYCGVSGAVARFGPGGHDSDSQWRCYEESIMNTTTKGVQCMDDCGNQMQCVGAVSVKTVATPPLRALSAFISQRRWIYCSSFQRSADALCNFKRTGNVARYDPGRTRWMCFNPVDISLEGQSYCANNCGGFTPCAGGLSPGEIPTRTVYIIQQSDTAEAFAALHPCRHDEICIPSTVYPPACVKAHKIIAIQQLSKQQEAMDNYCQTEMDQMCRVGKWTTYCYQLWLSRMVSTEEDEEPKWRCYPFALLNFSDLSTCIDGCSNRVPCHGAPSPTSTLTTEFSKLKTIAENIAFCSPFQKAANDHCNKRYGEGWVARQDVTTDDWACFQTTKLPTYRWTGCVDNCGNTSLCAAGVPEQLHSAAAEAFVHPDPALERVVESVPSPCLTGESCTPTAMNPPYCSETRPNPQPAPLRDHTIRNALDCSKGAPLARRNPTSK
ncbi:putative microneme protein [Toxoplasma gondii FOU]|uniref:Putative microneme protein n=1 Tax=Toxoplasma gondii FOU TaxID=943167 RepID=A0A086KYN8_TOXGO|nr:putative microneme protein [Toxoplasma gondii FOU]